MSLRGDRYRRSAVFAVALLIPITLGCQQAQPTPAVIDDMEQVLSALEIRCTESRATTPSLTDVAVKAVALAKQRGRDLTTLEALRMLEGSIHEGADMKINCTDASRRLFSEL